MSDGLQIIDPGVLTTIQDEGRPGLAAFAVSPSGAADKPAYRLANRVVGNRGGAAALELTFGGVRIRADRDLVLAVTGAPLPVTLDGVGVAMGQAIWARAGSELVFGWPSAGLRSYLGVRGGIEVDAVLGSRSTDTLGHLGHRPLAAGDRLEVGEEIERMPAPDQVPTHPIETHPVFDLIPGPRLEWMETASAGLLTSATFSVSDRLDRIGARLVGPPLRRAITRELPSEAVILGAVQLPPNGEPIIFGPDHPTTGGYPVVAVVSERQLPMVAQLRPGQDVRFRWLR